MPAVKVSRGKPEVGVETGLAFAMAPAPCAPRMYPDPAKSLHMTGAGSRSVERICTRILFKAKSFGVACSVSCDGTGRFRMYRLGT